MLKTLIIAPNWIGDALMAQPLLTLLKRAEPNQRISVLAPTWVAPVFDAMPEVDQVIGTALAHRHLQWQARKALAQQLRSEHFDRAFVLPNSFKSALIPWLARIPQRIGYAGEHRYGVLNLRHKNPSEKLRLPMAQRYAALAQTAALALPTELPLPHLVVAQASSDAVCAKFKLERQRPIVALCPGAEYGPAKRWPAAHHAALVEQILQRDPKAQVILLGGPDDRSITADIEAQALSSFISYPALHNLAGRTTLAEAMALIAASAAVVSNDSGLMHIAAALQRSQVAIFGSSDPRHTPPLSPKAEILWLQLACSPCFERTCPLGHLNCLKQIPPQHVMQALMQAVPSLV